MGRIFESLRSGTWLTAERVRLIAIAVLVASAAGVVYLAATSDGLLDAQGRPLGTDFSNVYAAGTYVLDGQSVAPFDPPLQLARERAIFGAATPFYGWHYPPFFLFIAAALALLPYVPALMVWQGVTFALYLWTMRAVLRASSLPEAASNRIWLLLAAAYPAMLVNLGHGHNGFLTAALLGAALVQLDRRPVLAGILFGLLAYKPQFGLMIPLVLIVTGRWRSVAAAGATVAALVLAATAAFGPQVWSAFLASTRYTRLIVLEAGETGWHKIQSIFSWTRMWGASVPVAYVVQGVATLMIAVALVWLWRSRAAFTLKAAALALAAILATPYSLDYDLMVLAPALAYLMAEGGARGFLSWEKTALALLWFVPLIARSIADLTAIPIGVIAMLVVFAGVIRRARADAAMPQQAVAA